MAGSIDVAPLVEMDLTADSPEGSRSAQGTTTTGTTKFSTISQKNDYISTSFNKSD